MSLCLQKHTIFICLTRARFRAGQHMQSAGGVLTDGESVLVTCTASRSFMTQNEILSMLHALVCKQAM